MAAIDAGHPLQQLPHLVLKPQLERLVHLVEHQQARAAQVDMAATLMVQQSTGSGDDDIGGDSERGFLVGNGMPAVAWGDLVAHSQRPHDLGRLHHQLTRRRQHNGLQLLHGRLEGV